MTTEIRLIPIAERNPDPFEECLILDRNHALTAGSWISTDEENREGKFYQGHHGVYEKDEVIGWIAIEKHKLSKGDRIIICYDDDV